MILEISIRRKQGINENDMMKRAKVGRNCEDTTNNPTRYSFLPRKVVVTMRGSGTYSFLQILLRGLKWSHPGPLRAVFELASSFGLLILWDMPKDIATQMAGIGLGFE